jgi:sulfate transport system substrate-binding protein
VKPDEADPQDMKRFPEVELVRIDDVFGGWQKAQKMHFDDGGMFDRIYTVGK